MDMTAIAESVRRSSDKNTGSIFAHTIATGVSNTVSGCDSRRGNTISKTWSISTRLIAAGEREIPIR